MKPLSVNHPTRVISGDHIGKQGELRLGCSAVLFNLEKDEILLTQRTDNGQWCLPGGMIDPGESVQEGCEREFFEETGLYVRVVRLSGVFSNPNRLTIYPDGNKAHVIVLCFEVEYIDGELGISNETLAAHFFSIVEAVEMDLFHGHSEHIRNAIEQNDRVLIQ